jgi:hypothetical protein
MTLANMYAQGVRRLIAYCRNDACRHQAVSSPAMTDRIPK